ncbi:uncharacterized protein JCM6883_002901 [Sporobolomyces salmoneus]|uniref:uncharacterized protein n=1 Tax=Sporobolomyces salmoneus TaxID=183962 RepID=UPI00317B27D4
MTITHPSQYVLNAPSPYLVQPSLPSSSSSPATSSKSTNLLPGYELVPSTDGRPSYSIFNRAPIEQSPNDDKLYRLIMLENGLEALIIQDPKADKASAAMDVKVGHLSDPEDLQGLAHFCEHLMFMGTEKYPKENDYTEFLTQHSGSSNAFTGMDQTCYFFDVSPSSLEPALDRFAQFFISPSFDPRCSEREANAVHSENSKNLQNDMWRMFQLDKSTSSRENHVYWRFGTGNKETLWDEPMRKGIDVRERLIDWCEKHYSANIAKLVVLSKDSLDKTTQIVVDQFSAVKNRNLSPPNFAGSPLTEKELGRTLFVKSVRDTRSLEITFPFPDESQWYSTKPGGFLSHLIGHEGKGSILSLLKERGWANGMSAGAGNGANGFEFFKIQVDMTQEGLDNYEEIAQLVFAYISLLRSSPPSSTLFSEVAALSSLAFRFKESSSPSNTTSMLSMSMSKPYPREKLLSAPWLCTEWHPQQVDDLLKLMTPENSRLFVVSQKEVGGRVYGEKEKWYGTEYCIEKTSDKILHSKLTASDFPGLHLPKPNQFVPQDLEIKSKQPVETPAKRPLNLKNSPTTRLWFKKDDRWWVPRAACFFLFRSPEIDSTAINSVSSKLFTELVRDSLNEYSYDADLAGLSYSFEQQGDGILLNADGYNDKLAVLLRVVVERMKGLKVDKKRSDIIVDQIRRLYVNFALEEPYNHVSIDASHLTQATSYTIQQKLDALSQITPESLQNHISRVLSRLHIEALVHGNMLKDEAISLSNDIESILSPQPLTPSELKSHQALVVPEGKHLYRRLGGNPENPNAAIEQFTYVGDIQDDLLRCKLALFGHIVSEPLFDVLRAKEQLGYIVSSGPRKSIGFMGLRVIVQSEKDAQFVETRIDAFWEEFMKTLEEMSEEEFGKYKEAVRQKKLEDHKNLWQESSHLWINIHSGWYDFEQRSRDASLLSTISKSSLIDFFRTHFFSSPSSPIRRLSIHLESPRLTPEQLATLLPVIASFNLEPAPDPKQLEQFVASRPTIDQALAFSETFLRGYGRGDEDVQRMKNEIEKLRERKQVPEGYEEILDMDEWRNVQERAPYAKPVKEYADLFPAKM